MTQPLTAGVVGLQALIGLTVVEAIRRRDASATINALVALFAALLPFGIELLVHQSTGPSFSFGPALPFWIALAGLVHSVGMLGRYDTTWWWDHLAHGISAALLAALVYASLIVVVAPPQGGALLMVQAGTIGVVLVAGLAWEVLEIAARSVADQYGIDPVLVNYGRRDTAFDLVFDLVGALLVVGLDLRVFVSLAARSPSATEGILVWSLGGVIAATVLTGSWVLLTRDRSATE